MKPKTFTITLSFAMLTCFAFAQKTKPSFGVTARVTIATYFPKGFEEDGNETLNSKAAFTAGVVSDFKMNKHFSFQPALYFVQKGGEEQSVDVNGNRNYMHTITLNYFELPLNCVYSTKPSKTVFFIGAGPSLSLGISGKIKIEAASEHSKEVIKFGSNDDRLKEFEFAGNTK